MNRRTNEPPLPEPLGYFLTWSTYGTWLPGDERGWTEYRHGWKPPDPIRKLEAEARMTENHYLLDSEQRRLAEQTIADHCRIRDWRLHAVNCRSNHVRVVVSAGAPPQRIQVQFKAWCTRRLKELERRRCDFRETGSPIREEWWAERGSRRWINDNESLEMAILYVRDYQDQPRTH